MNASTNMSESGEGHTTAFENPPTPVPQTKSEQMRLMRERGFCSHQIEHLENVYWRKLDRFAAMDRRAARPESHRACRKNPNCVAYNSPLTEAYRTQHAPDCEGEACYMVETPRKDLLRTIESGAVPLISIHEDRRGRLSLQVHRRGFRTRYATISHVWADGLGNPHQNALPLCQIKRLRSIFAEHRDNEKMKAWMRDHPFEIFPMPRPPCSFD